MSNEQTENLNVNSSSGTA